MSKLNSVAPKMCHYQSKNSYEPVDAEHAREVAEGRAELWQGKKNGMFEPRVVRYTCSYTCRDENPGDLPRSEHGVLGDAYRLQTLVEYTGHNPDNNASALCPGYVETGSQFNPDTLQNMPEMDMVPRSVQTLREGVSNGKARIITSTRGEILDDRRVLRALAANDSSVIRGLDLSLFAASKREHRAKMLGFALAENDLDFARGALDAMDPVTAGTTLRAMQAETRAELEAALDGDASLVRAQLGLKVTETREALTMSYPAVLSSIAMSGRTSVTSLDGVGMLLLRAKIAAAAAGALDMVGGMDAALEMLAKAAQDAGHTHQELAVLRAAIDLELETAPTSEESDAIGDLINQLIAMNPPNSADRRKTAGERAGALYQEIYEGGSEGAQAIAGRLGGVWAQRFGQLPSG